MVCQNHRGPLTSPNGDDPPQKHAEGDVSRRSAKLIEKHVPAIPKHWFQTISEIVHSRWYLHEYITNIEATDKSIELLSCHVKVLFQAFESRRPFQESANLRYRFAKNELTRH